MLRYDEFVRRLKGRGYVLKCDIHHYFASIDHKILKSLIRKKIGDQRLLRLLDSLIDTHQEDDCKGIPIGNLTSQLFANIYLSPLDHFIKEHLRQKYHIRYMDDFVILSEGKDELRDVLKEIKYFLTDCLRLELNTKRVSVHPIEKGIDFLGYVVFSGGYKRIRRRNIVNFRRRLKRLAIGYGEGSIPYDQAHASIASWMGLARHANAFRLSYCIFLKLDVSNIGKRLMLNSLLKKS